MVFSCAVLNSYEPMRLAGTWKQYSANAISQLMTMTLNKGVSRYFRWPYQAKVMKILERVSRTTVVMRICCVTAGCGCKCGPVRIRASQHSVILSEAKGHYSHRNVCRG